MNSSARDFALPSTSSYLWAWDHSDQSHHQNEKQHITGQYQRQNFSSLIQSGSIQNQFTILSNQRNDFIRERKEADMELIQVQKENQSVAMEHDALVELKRRAKEELGQRIEKLVMLKEEESRISRLTENEFNAIYHCLKHSNVLAKEYDDTTKRYTIEVDPLNFELAAVLECRIQKKTERCITVQSVETVVLQKFGQALLGKNKPQLMNQKENLYESIEFLKRASEQRMKYISILGDLRDAQQLQNGIETEVDFGPDTEALGDYTNKRANEIDIFYGPSRNH